MLRIILPTIAVLAFGTGGLAYAQTATPVATGNGLTPTPKAASEDSVKRTTTPKGTLVAPSKSDGHFNIPSPPGTSISAQVPSSHLNANGTTGPAGASGSAIDNR